VRGESLKAFAALEVAGITGEAKADDVERVKRCPNNATRVSRASTAEAIAGITTAIVGRREAFVSGS
jgi:hypothetical protein